MEETSQTYLNSDESIKDYVYKLEGIYNIMPETGREDNLSNFIKFLEKEMQLDLNSVKFDLNTRIKLQKYVFFAPYFDLHLGYEDTFNLYHYGPYSPTLAHDYFKLLLDWKQSDDYILPTTFKKESFKRILQNKNVEWLELAATAKLLFEANKTLTIDQLTDAVSSIKGQKYNSESISAIINEAGSLLTGF